MNQELLSAHLFFKNGSSDKEYKVEIVGDDASGYFVAYHYGKRGSKLRTGFKNTSSVDYDTACRIYSDVLDRQLRQGYKPADSSHAIVIPEELGKVSGLIPQLLNKIDEAQVQGYLDDDTYIMQEKEDGERCMIRKAGKTIEGINKKGKIVSIPAGVEEIIKEISGRLDCVVDGELVGEQFRMFDLLQIGVHAVATQKCIARLEAMEEWGFTAVNRPNFHVVKTAVGKAIKREMFNRLRRENAEGVVFKKADSVSTPGKPNSGGPWVKFKFYATAHVRVRGINDKRSVQMEVLEKGDWKYVGDVTIPVNHDVPKVGQIVDVRYLYAFPRDGSIFQSSYIGPRKDVDEDECLKSQLKYKQGTAEEEEEG